MIPFGSSSPHRQKSAARVVKVEKVAKAVVNVVFMWKSIPVLSTHQLAAIVLTRGHPHGHPTVPCFRRLPTQMAYRA